MVRLEPLVTEPDDFLVLPIAGRDGVVRDYTIPPVPSEFWYRVSAIGDVVFVALAGIQPRPQDLDLVKGMDKATQYELVLSKPIVDQMMADGIAGPHLQRAFTAALVLHTSGGDVERAKAAWSSGKAESRADRRGSKTSSRRK